MSTIRSILTIPYSPETAAYPTFPDDSHHPVLCRVCEPVAEITPEIQALVEDMFTTMYAAGGIGLAAPQIGEQKRIFVVDVDQTHGKEGRRVFINPEIIDVSEEKKAFREGCLSIPGFAGIVERPDKIRMRYMTLAGKTEEVEADGLLSVCLQHEFDHLNGVLFITYLPSAETESFRDFLQSYYQGRNFSSPVKSL